MIFREIEDAFMFVNFDGNSFDNEAIICRKTGKIHYYSPEYEGDFGDRISEEDFDPDVHIEVPDKRDLDLGVTLVFDFMKENLPDDYEDVRDMFRSRGAYGRFKNFLERKGALDEWHDYENSRTRETILRWCRDNGIQLEDIEDSNA